MHEEAEKRLTQTLKEQHAGTLGHLFRWALALVIVLTLAPLEEAMKKKTTAVKPSVRRKKKK